MRLNELGCCYHMFAPPLGATCRLKQQISTLREQNQQLAACQSGAHGQCDWAGLAPNAHETCSALLQATHNLTKLTGDGDHEEHHSRWTFAGTLSRMIAAIFLLGESPTQVMCDLSLPVWHNSQACGFLERLA